LNISSPSTGSVTYIISGIIFPHFACLGHRSRKLMLLKIA